MEGQVEVVTAVTQQYRKSDMNNLVYFWKQIDIYRSTEVL